MWQEVEAAESLAAGDLTGWFDQLYEAGRRGEVNLPWDRGAAHPLLAEWARRRPDERGRQAVVVGCGLGHDAEFVAGLGFAVVGFDISPTAIAVARDRHPGSPVRYVVADLLDLPAGWSRVTRDVALPLAAGDEACDVPGSPRRGRRRG